MAQKQSQSHRSEIETAYQAYRGGHRIGNFFWPQLTFRELEMAFLNVLRDESHLRSHPYVSKDKVQRCLAICSLELLDSLGVDFDTAILAIHLRISGSAPMAALTAAANELDRLQNLRDVRDKMAFEQQDRENRRHRQLETDETGALGAQTTGIGHAEIIREMRDEMLGLSSTCSGGRSNRWAMEEAFGLVPGYKEPMEVFKQIAREMEGGMYGDEDGMEKDCLSPPSKATRRAED
jgi:hypothetical protein